MAYKLKTQVNDADVKKFLDSIEDEQKREDSYRVMKMMQEITGCEPKMWGRSIVGFDTYHYEYSSGQSGDWMVTGFSPRKANLTLYVMNGFVDMDDKLSRLGKHKIGKSCLYIKRLSDVDENILREMIKDSVAYMKKTYP
jgi:hypothetical protein